MIADKWVCWMKAHVRARASPGEALRRGSPQGGAGGTRAARCRRRTLVLHLRRPLVKYLCCMNMFMNVSDPETVFLSIMCRLALENLWNRFQGRDVHGVSSLIYVCYLLCGNATERDMYFLTCT